MNSMVFFGGAIFTLSVSLLLRKNTEPHCECGAEAYAWRRMRRLVGTILLVVAAIAGVIGVLALVSSSAPAYFQQD